MLFKTFFTSKPSPRKQSASGTSTLLSLSAQKRQSPNASNRNGISSPKEKFKYPFHISRANYFLSFYYSPFTTFFKVLNALFVKKTCLKICIFCHFYISCSRIKLDPNPNLYPFYLIDIKNVMSIFKSGMNHIWNILHSDCEFLKGDLTKRVINTQVSKNNALEGVFWYRTHFYFTYLAACKRTEIQLIKLI
ncbi:MAG: hypothetical protein FD155_2649 [Bacteroidetes bacterium]|nr:MAG: hypothetical protein FD155_2649 [Bacteroidota bacterium]